MEKMREYKPIEIQTKIKPFIKINNESGSEDIHYSLFYKDLPEEIKACARRELNETEEKTAKGMKRLRDFIKRENMTGVIDDLTAICFLRNCKYDVSKAEAKVLKFHKSYRKLMRIVVEMDLGLIEKILNEDVFGFLPYRDKHGSSIMFSRNSLSPVITDNLDVVVVLAVALAFLVCKCSPITSVAGIASIACHKNIPLTQYYSLMKVVKNHYGFWMNLPMRYRRADIVNEHPFTRFFYKILRPFSSLKSYERICFNGSNLGGLLQYYHPDLLPEEFGGNMGPIRQISVREEMLSIIKILKEDPEAFK